MSDKKQKKPDSSDEEFQKKLAGSKSKKDDKPRQQDELDALARKILHEETQPYPCLGIYGGQTGSFELIEDGKEKTTPIDKKLYYLPMDTDIIKINAHTVRLTGYRDEVEEIGDFTLNASHVEFVDCPSLAKLPKMDRVKFLLVEDARSLQILPSVMNVRQVVLKNTGIEYLPKSLSRSQIVIQDCPNLKYIHPAIPSKNVRGIPSEFVLAMKVNYMLSELVPLEEKSQYKLNAKAVSISDTEVEVLPPCFGRAKITIKECPKLQYIHPEVPPKQIHGLAPETVSRYKMNYLFKKLNDNDDRFNAWFKRVKREMKANSRVR